ncbi:MAG: HAMP domain-containing histidine kinase [Verrucomicrobia bacterium]|nr:HAMP domain-containing histidine kinase [Verrucomicrobiota bacterium]
MSALSAVKNPGLGGFRAKLLAAMMLVVLTLTGVGLLLAQRKVAADVERGLRHDFQAALATLHGVQEVRQAVLAERCRTLVRRPRIHAALEDDALDLLYLNAEDELRDVMDDGSDEPSGAALTRALHAQFYRFLDRTGAVISPPDPNEVGGLRAEEEAQLALDGAPNQQQIGYVLRAENGSAAEAIDQVIAVPIVSTDTGEVIAALVLGFKTAELDFDHPDTVGIKSGIWLNGRLHLPVLAEDARAALSAELTRAIARSGGAESSLDVRVGGTEHLLFYKQLNPGSRFPPAYEVCVYPLAGSLARLQQLQWRILGAGALLLLGALVVSHFLSARLSVPVEKLAVDSEENRVQRQRAETALERTSADLQRAARFSADASHQLKTPLSVLRAGLEELLAQEDLIPEMRDEIAMLVHQTYRLTSLIEDLLLLSRMEAGRLQLELSAVNLIPLIEGWLDDFSAMPDPLNLDVQLDLPAEIHVAGEKRYTMLILQNLLENARKYNRPGGCIRLKARVAGDRAVLTLGNTGHPIPPAAQEHIFERFHRGSAGENIPGHGLGLNLAQELARLHGGELRLVRSDESWTEFEVRFCVMEPVPVGSVECA